jgi:hypothetical protein
LYLQQIFFKKLQKRQKSGVPLGDTTIPLWFFGDTHMSLEQALERNTEMMKDLIRALEGFQPTAVPPAQKVEPPSVLKQKPEPEPATPTPPAQIDYAEVAAAITSVFKVDRAKVVAALSKFGATKGPQLKPEDYAAFLQELNA